MVRLVALSVAVAVSLLGACAWAGGGPRSDILLNGDWLVQKAGDLSAPPAGDWKPLRVPGYLSGTNYECAWLMRTFPAEAAWAGRRIILHFGGVKFASVVLLNGRKVGGNLGGYEPFEVDITDAVRLGATNELLVGVRDWTGVFHERVDLEPAAGWDELRGRPKNALLSPIGGLFSLYGIWDDVTLRVRPPVHVTDVFVKTSVRRKRLEAEVSVVNAGAAPQEFLVSGQVLDRPDGARVLDLPGVKLALKPGETRTVTLARDWPDPRLWSHVTPTLYDLRIELAGHDACATRFGFREFRADKDAFYLNGTRVNLLATSAWPQHRVETKAEAAAMFQAIKAANCVAMRLHTQPWQRRFYEAADEAGVLIVVEGAVWCDQNYRFEDPAWWENYATHLRRTVGNLKNHPSVVLWSLENEILHCATWQPKPDSPAKAGLVRMGRLVKGWDPTRPIFYEADLDPGGVADVIGLHYPEPEYPRVNQYPNVCYWMDQDIRMRMPLVDGPRETWKWDRAKPLYIGEYLWVSAPDPSADTIFLGDEAYRDAASSRARAKAAAWRMQTEAYRGYGVNGLCPWTMFEGPGGVLAREKNPLWVAVRDSYQPNAVFIKEYDTRFFAGDTIARTLMVHNDTFAPGDFTLAWRLACGGKTSAEGEESLTLGPAARKTLVASFRAPDVAKPEDAVFTVALRRKDGPVCFEQSKPCRIFPRVKLSAPPGCRLVLYDPAGTTRGRLAGAGLTLPVIPSLDQIPRDANALVIGDRALKTPAPEAERVVGMDHPDRTGLTAFVRGGGRVLVLAQSEYPGNLLPVRLADHASTMTFPQTPDHPLLRGVSRDDVMFWSGDHLVSEHEVVRPMVGGCRPLVVSGSASGLAYAPLLELPRGSGTLVLCQMRLLEKLDSEPAARRLLQNALDYLATFAPDTRPTAVASDSADFKRLLTALGLRFQDVTGALDPAALPVPGLLIVAGDSDEIAAKQKGLRSYLEAGGRALFHNLAPKDLERLDAIFPGDVALQPHRGRVAAINRADPMTLGWTRESLYWLGQHKGPSHAPTPLADGVADYALVSRRSGPAVLSVKATDMALDGHLVRADGDHVAMYTVGSVSGEIAIPEFGRYGLVITARGTPLEGVWPMVEVSLDGEPLDILAVPDRNWMTLSAPADLQKGSHTVRVSFVNDASAPGEDRNLFVKQVKVTRLPPGAEPFVALTRPAFVARFDAGRGGAVVDEIAWSTDAGNTEKAMAYARGLLTALGADFEDAWGDVIGPDSLVVDKAAVFDRTPEFVCLASSGAVATRVVFANAGRYTFELTARGTPLDGVYPIVEVQLDGKPVGSLDLQADGWRPYTLDAQVSRGEHEIRLVFTNDAYRPPEDRNVYIQGLRLIRR